MQNAILTNKSTNILIHFIHTHTHSHTRAEKDRVSQKEREIDKEFDKTAAGNAQFLKYYLQTHRTCSSFSQ